MKRSIIGTTLALTLALVPATSASASTASFAYTGGEQTFKVPAGVSSVHVVAVGGTGAYIAGGQGGLVGADVSVTAGATLYVEVGGNGSMSGPGFNGGGPGGSSLNGGAGASDVRGVSMFAAGSLQSRLIVAGGGGGGGGGGTAANGAGGGAGQAGASAASSGNTATGGGAGTATSGGAGGAPSNGATAGALGVGGTGGDKSFVGSSTDAQSGSGGGGGGGYYGGGGGGAFAVSGSGGGGGGGGGSSFAVSGGSFALTSAPPSVTITYTVGASGNGGSSPSAAAVSGLTFSNATFAAQGSGPPATNARKKAARGTKVSFRLNEAAKVRFTVTQRVKGRKVKRGKKTVCVKPTHKNRKRKRCTRVVTLKGSFTRIGAAGKNSFHFTGRLNGRKLKPGRYRLVATPTVGGTKGKPTSSAFRIVR
jgi:hypothetical protein